jgi:hypothetical protein
MMPPRQELRFVGESPPRSTRGGDSFGILRRHSERANKLSVRQGDTFNASLSDGIHGLQTILPE